MDNEQIERQMAFILEHQAKFSANLEKLQERDAHWEARMAIVDRQIEQLVGFAGTLRDALLGLTHHVERNDEQIERNYKQIERNDEQIAKINRGLAELVERGKETDARLNVLSLIMERHISGHQ